MDASSAFTVYDFVVLGILVLLVVRGAWLGFLREITGFVALYFGYFVASQYHKDLFPFLEEVSTNPKVVFLTSYVLLFVATYLVCMLLGRGLRYVVQLSFTSWFDKVLGAIVGFGKALVFIVILHMVLGTILAPENQMIRKCATCDVVSDLTDVARSVIQDSEVRKALVPKEPAISLDKIKEYLEPITPFK